MHREPYQGVGLKKMKALDKAFYNIIKVCMNSVEIETEHENRETKDIKEIKKWIIKKQLLKKKQKKQYSCQEKNLRI